MQPTFEIQMRELVQNERPLDIGAYNWIATRTRPSDLFVTDGWAAFAVMGAGRRLVATPEVFSNAYLTWAGRDARRLRFIAAIRSQNAASSRALCDLLAETGRGNTAFFLLPNEDLVATDTLELVWRGNYHSVYRVNPITCKPDEKPN
jgi:hypothetical protein